MDNFKGKSEKILSLIITVFLISLVLVVSYIALMRNLFSSTPAWGESLALLIMVWFCLLSGALGVSNDIHIRMTILENFISEKKVRFLDHFANILWIIFGFCAVFKGMSLVRLGHNNIVTGINLPSSVIYMAVPIFGIIVLISTIIREVKLCKQI